MIVEQVINELKSKKYYLLNPEKLDVFLSEVKIINESDTKIYGMIRIVKYNNIILTQELTNINEVSIRKFKNKEEASKFIDERLDVYDRMWDGCGCKVDYYS